MARPSYPVVMYLAAVSVALPLVAIQVMWGRFPPAPLRRLRVWCGFLLLANLVELVIAFQTQRANLWFGYYSIPVEVALFLWTVAGWHQARVARLYLLAVPLALLGAVVVIFSANQEQLFSVIVGPVLSLLALFAVMHTLVACSLASTGLLTRQDWFWICLGFALFWTCFAPLPAFAEAFVISAFELVNTAYIVRAWLIIAAFLLISWGVICPRVPTRLSQPS